MKLKFLDYFEFIIWNKRNMHYYILYNMIFRYYIVKSNLQYIKNLEFYLFYETYSDEIF